MNFDKRLARLERKLLTSEQSIIGPPPIDFFDRMLDDTLTDADWKRWEPWLTANLSRLSNHQVEQFRQSDRNRLPTGRPISLAGAHQSGVADLSIPLSR